MKLLEKGAPYHVAARGRGRRAVETGPACFAIVGVVTWVELCSDMDMSSTARLSGGHSSSRSTSGAPHPCTNFLGRGSVSRDEYFCSTRAESSAAVPWFGREVPSDDDGRSATLGVGGPALSVPLLDGDVWLLRLLMPLP